ncbi:MAG: glycosyltransferase family 39 protein [Saprospiraceae bacterium]
MSAKNRLFYAFPFLIFFFLAAPEFVRRSMYNDGIWYAILSKNMAEGIGSFWNPQLTATIFPAFHEHPPLVFGMQSFFFSFLGDSLVVERLYAFFIFLLSALVIFFIWQQVFSADKSLQKLWFLPFTLWLLNEVTYLFYAANILEPTMGLFTLLAVYCLFLSTTKKEDKLAVPWIALSGIALLGATLSKGFVGLFPLAVLGIHWLVFRQISFVKMLLRTSVMLGILALGYTLILALPAAKESLLQYLNSQVIASISEARTAYHFRENRLYIIWRLFEVLLPALILSSIFIYLSFKQKPTKFSKPLFQQSLFFMLIGISASFPLMVSPRQTFYYLLPAIPYFAIGLAMLISPIIAQYLQTISEKNKQLNRVKVIFVVLLLAGVGLTISKIGTVSHRDKITINDIDKIGAIVPNGTTIASKGYTAQLVGYLYRFHQISIDTSHMDYPYLVVDKTKHKVPDTLHFQKIALENERFELYERK